MDKKDLLQYWEKEHLKWGVGRKCYLCEYEFKDKDKYVCVLDNWYTNENEEFVFKSSNLKEICEKCFKEEKNDN